MGYKYKEPRPDPPEYIAMCQACTRPECNDCIGRRHGGGAEVKLYPYKGRLLTEKEWNKVNKVNTLTRTRARARK